MNKPYIIKKMYERDGKKYRDYLGGFLNGKSNHVYWVPLRTGAATFTLDEGNETIKALNDNNFNNGARYALLVHVNETVEILKERSSDTEIQFDIDYNNLKITDLSTEDKNYTGNLYMIRENVEDRIVVGWLHNLPELNIAPKWAVHHSIAATFSLQKGKEMIRMLKENRMVDYQASHTLVLVDMNDSSLPQVHYRSKKTDDAEAAFDRASEVL